jgi:hypothetical protein
MTIHYTQEFETVDIVANSTARTRGVDAFAMSLIKAERQIRKLVTHLIFQFPCFGQSDIPNLRQTLANNTHVYLNGLERGFDALYPRTVGNLVGSEYQRLRGRMQEATEYRNKIFHGQITSTGLTRDDLLAYVTDIRAWCKALADATLAEFEYDGFAWNSFRKSAISDLSTRLKVQIASVAEYDAFVRQYMER